MNTLNTYFRGLFASLQTLSRVWCLTIFSFASAFLARPAFANNINVKVSIDDVAENIVDSGNLLPGLITALCYMFAIILGVQAVLKLKEHVESPAQNPIRVPIIRFAIGGALLALPIITQAMEVAFNAGVDGVFDNGNFSMGGLLSGVMGILGGALGGISADLNAVMATVIKSIESTPAFITALAYVMGLLASVSGLFKLKDHVENPDQTPMREAVIRFLFGGALFAIPTIFIATTTAINGDNGVGILGQVSSGLGALGWIRSTWTGGVCDPTGITGIATGSSLGTAICETIGGSAAAPAFLSAISYAFGLVLVLWGLVKLRDHALNPAQTKVTEGVSRLAAGGLFFTLPVTVEVIRGTMTPIALTAQGLINSKGYTSYNEDLSGQNACNGLDGAVGCFMQDFMGPMHSMLNFFTFTVGMIFIMIGVSRLIKSAQDGPKGPSGLGTMGTFAVGGLLISYNEIMRVFGKSIFGGGLFNLNNITGYNVTTNANLQYVDGIDAAELQHAHTMISSVIKFMIVVGLISFIRGLFIVRNVAEGNGQASMMAGMTHLIGGALAVNLGPLINAIQVTLGITEYGIVFS